MLLIFEYFSYKCIESSVSIVIKYTVLYACVDVTKIMCLLGSYEVNE